MYFVRSGFVDLIMDGAVVDTVQAGDFFGEVALLSLPPTSELLEVWPLLRYSSPDCQTWMLVLTLVLTARRSCWLQDLHVGYHSRLDCKTGMLAVNDTESFHCLGMPPALPS